MRRTGSGGFRWGPPLGTFPETGRLGAECRRFIEIGVVKICGSLGGGSRGRWPGSDSIGAVGLINDDCSRNLLSCGVSGGGRPGPGGRRCGRFGGPFICLGRDRNRIS